MRGSSFTGSFSFGRPVKKTPSTPIIFTVSGTWVAPSDVTSVRYIVVGGGGGGGNGFDTGAGGGGGAGMFLTGIVAVTPGQTYNIQVGAQGIGGANVRSNVDGTDGGQSAFGTIVAAGGEGGAGSRTFPLGIGLGGAAQVSNTTSGRRGQGGQNGASSTGGSGGGGGGSSGAGVNGNSGSGGSGGAGTFSNILGTNSEYSRGGNGARGNTTSSGAPVSGYGFGGNAGGGAAFASGSGSAGGQGIVVIVPQ